MKDTQQAGLLRWFLLLWMALIYFWGMGFQPYGDSQDDRSTSLTIVLFTVLMLIHIAAHWIFLSGIFSKLGRYWPLFYGIFQGILALGICLVSHKWDIMISLCLTLLLEAGMLQGRTRLIVIGCYLLVFMSAVGTLYFMRLQEGWEALQLQVFGAPVFLFAVGYVILYLQQDRARVQAQTLLNDLEVAHAQLSAYAVHVEELTLATERQRLARELHDTLVQGLAGLTMQLEVANLRLTNQRYEPAQVIIQQAMVRTRATLAEARNAINDLRLNAERGDLPTAVQEEIDRFAETSELSCTANIQALSLTPLSLREHVLRMISEGLTNAAHHAYALHVWVSATHDVGKGKNRLIIEVRDDGIGFDPTVVSTQVGHYGLLGLRERARLMRGNLEILSAPGKGTTLRLFLPIEQGGVS